MGVRGSERVALERSMASFFWTCCGDGAPSASIALEKEKESTAGSRQKISASNTTNTVTAATSQRNANV